MGANLLQAITHTLMSFKHFIIIMQLNCLSPKNLGIIHNTIQLILTGLFILT